MLFFSTGDGCSKSIFVHVSIYGNLPGLCWFFISSVQYFFKNIFLGFFSYLFFHFIGCGFNWKRKRNCSDWSKQLKSAGWLAFFFSLSKIGFRGLNEKKVFHFIFSLNFDHFRCHPNSFGSWTFFWSKTDPVWLFYRDHFHSIHPSDSNILTNRISSAVHFSFIVPYLKRHSINQRILVHQNIIIIQ